MSQIQIRNGLFIVFLIFLMIVTEMFGDEGRVVLRFDSDRISQGEWYRMITGHFVHLSLNHLGMNVAGLLLFVGLFSSMVSVWELLIATASYSLLIAVGMLLDGGIGWYVGFSGVLYGLFVYGVLRDQRSTLITRVVMISLMLAKIIYDMIVGGDASLSAFIGGPVLAIAHLLGVLLALCHFGSFSLYRHLCGRVRNGN